MGEFGIFLLSDELISILYCTTRRKRETQLYYSTNARTLDFFTETAIDKPLLNVAYA